MHHRILDSRLNLKALSDDGTFEGYASVFDEVDSYGDKVASGAFADSLAEHKAKGTMPAMLWQHRADEPIGVYQDMHEDGKGLHVTGKLIMEASRAKEAHALLKGGGVNGLSIGFMTESYEWDEESQIRTLTKINLWETSIVTFPALDSARVQAVKLHAARVSCIRTFGRGETPPPSTFERALREAMGLSESQAKAVMANGYRALSTRDAPDGNDDAIAGKLAGFWNR